MDQQRTDLIDRLESSGREYIWHLDRLQRLGAPDPSPPGEWSVHRIAAHMRDTEWQVFFLRAERLFNEEQPLVENFDQEAWDRAHYDANEPLDKVKAEFKAARKKFVRLLREASMREWDNWALHPEYGKISLDWLLEHGYYHTLEHITQIGKLREHALLQKLNR